MTRIEWERVAAPQADGHDLEVALLHAKLGRYGRQSPRGLPANAPLVWPDGRARFVTMEAHAEPARELKDMPLDNPQLLEGLALLEHWPEVRALSAGLLVAVCPMAIGIPAESRGGTCGHYGDDFGWIYATADNAWGFAEGVVHEMGHWKLRALGIWFEEWTDTLLLNAPSELYASPVRKDKARPMGAVLHAQYSYIHVADMCARMLEQTAVPSDMDIGWAELQLKRITEGQGTINEHARWTDAGAAFAAGVDAWTTEVRERGARIVNEARTRMQT